MTQIKRVPKEAWAEVSEKAHLVVFGKHKPAEQDRIDFALLAVDETDTPLGYITCRELDAKTVYWSFGGAFPGTKGTIVSPWTYDLFIAEMKGKYDRITTHIENTNLPMLKLAMRGGFRIIGVRVIGGSVLLEHVRELCS